MVNGKKRWRLRGEKYTIGDENENFKRNQVYRKRTKPFHHLKKAECSPFFFQMTSSYKHINFFFFVGMKTRSRYLLWIWKRFLQSFVLSAKQTIRRCRLLGRRQWRQRQMVTGIMWSGETIRLYVHQRRRQSYWAWVEIFNRCPNFCWDEKYRTVFCLTRCHPKSWSNQNNDHRFLQRLDCSPSSVIAGSFYWKQQWKQSTVVEKNALDHSRLVLPGFSSESSHSSSWSRRLFLAWTSLFVLNTYISASLRPLCSTVCFQFCFSWIAAPCPGGWKHLHGACYL